MRISSPTILAKSRRRYSRFGVAAWIAFVIGVAFEKSLIAYAYHVSPTYSMVRFERNVGPRNMLVDVLCWISVTGILLSLAGTMERSRKTWPAWLALALNLYFLAAHTEVGLSSPFDVAAYALPIALIALPVRLYIWRGQQRVSAI